jgi:carbon monoxide dehydrogenase subunit G
MAANDLRGTWRTTAPRADVWSVVVDLCTWPRWWPAIDEAEITEGDATAPQAGRLTFATPVRPLRVELAVTGLVHEQRLDVVTAGGPVQGTGRLELADEDAGTAVEFAVRMDVRSRLFKPVERLLSNASRSGGDRLRKAGDDLARLAGGEPGDHDV